jgi:ribosome-associated protein
VIVDSKAKALLAAQAALDKQGEDVAILDVRGLSSVTDFFIVCTAVSARQLDAIRDHIDETLARHGAAVWHTEGAPAAGGPSAALPRSPQWVLMDCGDVVVHLLDQETRQFYRLEDLWADAPKIPLPAPPPARTLRLGDRGLA